MRNFTDSWNLVVISFRAAYLLMVHDKSNKKYAHVWHRDKSVLMDSRRTHECICTCTASGKVRLSSHAARIRRIILFQTVLKVAQVCPI